MQMEKLVREKTQFLLFYVFFLFIFAHSFYVSLTNFILSFFTLHSSIRRKSILISFSEKSKLYQPLHFFECNYPKTCQNINFHQNHAVISETLFHLFKESTIPTQNIKHWENNYNCYILIHI